MTIHKICGACGSENNTKWGKRRGKQCYRCNDCGYQFSVEIKRHSEIDERKAITLYCLGLPLRTIGKLMSYHHTTILRWIQDFVKQNRNNPKPKSEVLLTPEEIFSFIEINKSTEVLKHIALLEKRTVIEIPPLLKRCITEG